MRADVMLVAMLVAFAVYMSAMFLLLPVLDNHGLWLALTAFLSLRGITLIAVYPRLGQAIISLRICLRNSVLCNFCQCARSQSGPLVGLRLGTKTRAVTCRPSDLDRVGRDPVAVVLVIGEFGGHFL